MAIVPRIPVQQATRDCRATRPHAAIHGHRPDRRPASTPSVAMPNPGETLRIAVFRRKTANEEMRTGITQNHCRRSLVMPLAVGAWDCTRRVSLTGSRASPPRCRRPACATWGSIRKLTAAGSPLNVDLSRARSWLRIAARLVLRREARDLWPWSTTSAPDATRTQILNGLVISLRGMSPSNPAAISSRRSSASVSIPPRRRARVPEKDVASTCAGTPRARTAGTF